MTDAFPPFFYICRRTRIQRVREHVHAYSQKGALVIPAYETRTVNARYCTPNGMPWSQTNMALCMETAGKRICDPPSAQDD